MQAGHDLLLMCDSDPGCRQARQRSKGCRSKRVWLSATPPPRRPQPPPAAVTRDVGPAPHPDCSAAVPAGMQVLRSEFPGVRIHDDVTSLDKLPEVGGRVA